MLNGHTFDLSLVHIADPKRYGKSFALDAEGVLRKEVIGHHRRGTVRRLRVDLEGLRRVIEQAEPGEHLMAAVPDIEPGCDAPLAAAAKARAGDLTRTDKHLALPAGAGVLCIDCDASGTDEHMLLAQLTDACPALEDVRVLMSTSSSANIEDAAGRVLTHGKVHALVPVVDAGDVPRALRVLFDRLWLAGHGRVEIAATGQPLLRSAVDLALANPLQPVFLRAHLGRGLSQRKRVSVMNEHAEVDLLDTRTWLPDLSDAERDRLQRMQHEAIAAVADACADAQATYKAQRIAQAVTRGVPQAQAERSVSDALTSGDLYADQTIVLASGQAVTVREILADAARYHGQPCRDPLEPDYGSASVARIYADQDKPVIRSFAHSAEGRIFHLHPYTAAEVIRMEFAPTSDVPARADTVVEDALLLHGTESHTALAYVRQARGRLVYCAAMGKWLEWTGTHWRIDESRKAFHYAVEHGRRIASANAKASKTTLRASFAAGVERIAAADPDLARTVDEFDRHPTLLATPAGVVDLRRGVLMPADPAMLITRCAGVGPENGKPERLLEFLRWALDGDESRIEFVQEFLGYALSGCTGLEQALYLDGPGGNGKGVLAAAMQAVLGDYYQQAPLNLLQYSAVPQHPTSLAALRGARIVWCSELPAGARLDEQRFKALTGGDRIRAHFMRSDGFEYSPEFKLVIAANHRPRIADPDEAMRRRLRVLAMPNVVANPDPAFKHVVIPGEAGRILAWLMEGCQRVLARGERIKAPPRVEADTDAYLASQDPVGRFLAEETARDHTAKVRRGDLYDAFTRWASASGEHRTMSGVEFAAVLDRRGMSTVNVHGIRFVRGLRLAAADARADFAGSGDFLK